MVAIIYVAHDGTRRTLDVAEGLTVMAGAVREGLPGIEAACGGACACATCQVFVDEAWMARLEPVSAMEADTLDMSDQAGPSSRLSCQIRVEAALDGLVVRMPERQH